MLEVPGGKAGNDEIEEKDMSATDELKAAIEADINPTNPDVLRAHPGYVLLDVVTGETWSLDPEVYRWFAEETDEEVRGSMELAIESAWLYGAEIGNKRVLVPGDLVVFGDWA